MDLVLDEYGTFSYKVTSSQLFSSFGMVTK
jgi:hypothetical protein